MINNKPLRFGLTMLAISSLVACNDSNDTPVVVKTPTVSTVPTVPTKVDNLVQQVISGGQINSENDKPKNIDALVLATDDDAKPFAVD